MLCAWAMPNLCKKRDPRWHGWGTPEQVREMMVEMYKFLQENKEECPFTIATALIVEK